MHDINDFPLTSCSTFCFCAPSESGQYLYIYMYVPQTDLSVGVLMVLDKGPWLVDCYGGASGSNYPSSLQQFVILPSNTYCKINNLMELLHSSPEGHHFLSPRDPRANILQKHTSNASKWKSDFSCNC